MQDKVLTIQVLMACGRLDLKDTLLDGWKQTLYGRHSGFANVDGS